MTSKTKSRFFAILIACVLLPLSALGEDESFFIFSSPEDDPALATETPEGETPQTVPPSAPAAGEVYVSPSGDDLASGTYYEPLQTLEAAISHAIMNAATEEVTIWLRGGEYYLDQTLQIAGDIQKRLTFRGYPGETPVITGARQITGFQPTTYMGADAWAVQLPMGNVRALYGLDGARSVSRWPKEGNLKVARSEAEAEDKFANQNGFYVNQNELPVQLDGATVRLLHWWKDELSGVKYYDSSTGYLSMNRPSAMTIEKGNEYWFENVLGVTLFPGEWVFDRPNQTLYYVPQEGETIENTPLYVGMTEQLIHINGVSNVTFDRITFARTNWNIPNNDAAADFPQAAYDAEVTVAVQQAENTRFTSCTFQDIGAGCIGLGFRTRGAVIFNCTFKNIGAHAVFIHGQNTTDTYDLTESITIENNEINGYGRNFINAAAILVVHASSIEIRFNEIHDGTYTAISAGWVWGTGFNATDGIFITNNLIYYIGKGVLSDMGAVYLLGAQPNTQVTGNVIHDVTAYDYGGWGIYLDEGSADIHVTSNLVYNCSAQGFHQHNGEYSTIRNNIFALNHDGQIGASGKGAFLLEQNIIVGKPYLNVAEAVSVKQRNNIKREGTGIFVDAANFNFNLTNDAAIKEVGFEPWVHFAGRYSVDQ